jgi:hypothetical protein
MHACVCRQALEVLPAVLLVDVSGTLGFVMMLSYAGDRVGLVVERWVVTMQQCKAGQHERCSAAAARQTVGSSAWQL